MPRGSTRLFQAAYFKSHATSRRSFSERSLRFNTTVTGRFAMIAALNFTCNYFIRSFVTFGDGDEETLNGIVRGRPPLRGFNIFA